MCSPAASTPHIGKHIHTYTHRGRPGPINQRGQGEKGIWAETAVFSCPFWMKKSSSLTSVFPHSQDGGILLGKKEREGSFRAVAFPITAGRRAFHSCAHLDQTGPKFEEQRFPREDRVTVCTRFV